MDLEIVVAFWVGLLVYHLFSHLSHQDAGPLELPSSLKVPICPIQSLQALVDARCLYNTQDSKHSDLDDHIDKVSKVVCQRACMIEVDLPVAPRGGTGEVIR